MWKWVARSASTMAVLLGVTGAQTLTASSAQAQEFDVWLSARDVSVSSGACRDIPFRIHHDGGLLERFAVDVEIWRGSQYLGESFDYQYDSDSSLKGSYYWCPFEGLGKYRVGPSSVEFSRAGDPEWDPYLEEWEETTEEGEFTDASRASFMVKQAQKVSLRGASKKRGRLVMSAKFRFFDVENSRWINVPDGTTVHMQRQVAGGWKKVASAKISSKGMVTVSGKAAKGKKTYRLIQKGTNRTWSASVQARR